MAEQPLKQFDDDIVDIKKQSLYARLKRLFSTDVIVRNVGGKQIKIKDTDNIMYATDRNSLRDRFNRIRATSYNAYSRDFALSYQAARMDLFRDYDCVGPDTIIPLPDGSRPTIAELAEKYKDKPQERFWVYSYDHKTDSIKLGKAYHPRKKGGGTREGFKVTFDNGQYVIGSIKHPFLMRDGTYKRIMELNVGDSVMPFYQKDFYGHGYRHIYDFSNGWKPEHVLVAEQFNRPLNTNEVVHHRDFNKGNNLPDNLHSFKNDVVSTLNHTIVSIEHIGPLEVYDVTVEEYHNFACDSCILKNTMDMDPILSSALDIYADECLTLNELKQMLVIHSKNNNIKKILHNLFYDILNIEGNMWSWTRNMCKYGDFFLRLHITPEYGIYMVEPISPYNVERIENADPYNKRYVKFQLRPTDTSQAEIVENYEMAHFRLLSDSNFLPYGKAMIEGARRVWKQLSLMEDAMLIHRIMRAPERRIFKIDVGAIPPNEVDAYMEKLISKVKKVPYMDERTGDYNLRFNLQSMVEDFYLPVRGGDSGTEIDTLSGMEWTGIEDLDYIKHKMLAALKIPKAFLNFEEDTSGKATLACVVPETQIPLMTGVTKTVKELIDDYNAGIKNYVYSIDESTKGIVAGEIEWAGYTRMNTDVVRVHLDNNKYIDCTPDHKFLLRNGTWVEAKDLAEGTSLMPLYKKDRIMRRGLEYETVYNPATDSWKWTHKLIDEAINGKLTQNTLNENGTFDRSKLVVIHHKDFNRHNNSPDNLQRLLFSDHISIHKKNTKCGILSDSSKQKAIATKRLPENRKKYSLSQSNRIKNNPKLKTILRDSWLAKTHSERSIICSKNWTPERRKISSDTCVKYNKVNNLIAGYKEKYKNGKFDTSGELNGKWRVRPSLDNIKEFIVNFKNKQDINNFQRLSAAMGYHSSILKEVINNGGYSVTQFMNENFGFAPGRPKNVINHTVIKIEKMTIPRDTCDITITKYHNFATTAGVFIHNSMDVRFARTIQRIQRLLVSELSKIAIVHLYAQGYRDESLVDFELELTNPSTIFEREKVEIWSDKVAVATDMMEVKLFSKDWIYKNIFNMSDDDKVVVIDQVVEDTKQKFRLTSIEEEGNDPAKPAQQINPGDIGGGGGGDEGGPDLGAPEGGPEGGLGGPEGGLGGPEGGEGGGAPNVGGGGPAGLQEKVEQDQSDRDQTGRKDASQYPFGEDPRGRLEIMSKPGSARETKPNPRSSPLGMHEGVGIKPKVDKGMISSLKSFLDKPLLQEVKELKSEVGAAKTLLDESNIIDE